MAMYMKPKAILILLALIAGMNLRGWSQTASHPKLDNEDVVSALQRLDVLLAKIDEPLFKLSAHSDPQDVALAIHTSVTQIRKVAQQWSFIISAPKKFGGGADTIRASNAFTVYKQLLLLQANIEILTADTDKMEHETPVILSLATTVVGEQNELFEISGTMQSFVADRIDAEEARCSTKSIKRKPGN